MQSSLGLYNCLKMNELCSMTVSNMSLFIPVYA